MERSADPAASLQGSSALKFDNSADTSVVRPIAEPKTSIVYFFRAGAEKPLAFDTIYAQATRGKIVLSLYQQPNWHIPEDCAIVSGGLSKYHAFHQVSGLVDFDYIFFLDADIDLPSFSEERLLNKLADQTINCAQFSLCDNSYSTFSFLKKQTDNDFRRVNFVEVMAPIFTRHGLDKVLHTFPMSISTWGLDFAWSKLFSGNGMYVIDTEQMTHTGKPDVVGGPFYRYLKSIGIDPRAESERMKNQFEGNRLFVGNIPPLVAGHFYGKLRWLLDYYVARLRAPRQ